MPGLSGGAKQGRGCGGGVDPTDCFSFRVMWRREGNGEAYIYAPEGQQGPDFCTLYPLCTGSGPYPCTYCDYQVGTSFGRGLFKFQTGAWQQLKLTVVLNDPDVANGHLELQYNGNTVISYDQMRWRTTADINIETAEFATWFGGSDATWSPPEDTFILLRNIKLFRTGPPTGQVAAQALGVDGSLKLQAPVQTVVEVKVEVGE